MAKKITGISHDLIIHPGETIGDILVERDISQAELAAITGVSAAYVCNVISGKKNISAKFALALEYALGIPKSFWINLQANYDAELLEANARESITDEERAVRNALKEVVKHLRNSGKMPAKESVDDSILSLRKALRISNLINLKSILPEGAFRLSSKANVDPYVVGAWIRLCQIDGENSKVRNSFDLSKIDELVEKAKAVMCGSDDIRLSLKELFSNYGIDFDIVRNFRGAPIQGYISRKSDDTYRMVLTIRGAYADIFWFSLFHELGHIVNGDAGGTGNFIDYNKTPEIEEKADLFAGSHLIDQKEYEGFIEAGDFRLQTIKKFAASQHIMPYMVIGRLQKEKILDYDCFSSEKIRYKWA
jgi:HTH-type transcriptional regulator/antitoxin HigA